MSRRVRRILQESDVDRLVILFTMPRTSCSDCSRVQPPYHDRGESRPGMNIRSPTLAASPSLADINQLPGKCLIPANPAPISLPRRTSPTVNDSLSPELRYPSSGHSETMIARIVERQPSRVAKAKSTASISTGWILAQCNSFLGCVCAGSVILTLLTAGCRVVQPALGLPAKYTLENEHLVVQSDIKLSRNHELLKDLDRLRDEILSTLDLPVQKQPVIVYLFGDENRYAQYLQTRYPRLPPRRAYFVGSTKELAVYTFWGERIQEDLRHEFTHGVLHATLKDVPLWLDEGLAEYFEVAGQPVGMNREYAMNLAAGIASGWKPDLDRLESLEAVDQMQKSDYQESWAWVHFLLHHSEDSREVLTSYLRELRTTSQPGHLSIRLRAAIPVADKRFLNHAAGLTDGVVRVGRIEPR